MDLAGRFSNPDLQAALARLIEYGHSPTDDHASAKTPAVQRQRRLDQTQVDDLTSRYVNGESVGHLATAFEINRTTVIGHLDRRGIERRPHVRKMTDALVSEAADLYEAGLSLAVVAKRVGVDDRTLRREFGRAGVQVRTRPGWPPAAQKA